MMSDGSNNPGNSRYGKDGNFDNADFLWVTPDIVRRKKIPEALVFDQPGQRWGGPNDHARVP